MECMTVGSGSNSCQIFLTRWDDPQLKKWVKASQTNPRVAEFLAPTLMLRRATDLKILGYIVGCLIAVSSIAGPWCPDIAVGALISISAVLGLYLFRAQWYDGYGQGARRTMQVMNDRHDSLLDSLLGPESIELQEK